MEKVKCSHCKKIILRNEASAYARNGEKEYYNCRECNTNRAKKYRATKRGKDVIYKAVKKSIKKHQYKQNARASLLRAVKSGKLIRPNKCTSCLKECTPEAHHHNYNEPLNVTWLCKSCHNLTHRLCLEK